MDKITKSLLDSFSDQNEIKNLQESTQFEHFCNFSIASKLFRGSFELDDIHTGSGGDIALDGILIIANGRLIQNSDELQDVVEVNGCLDADICFIQAKTSSNFDGSAIGNLIHGVKDFLSDNPRLVHNQRITELKSVWESIISMSSHMVNRRPNCKIYYICTGKWLDDKNLRAIIDSGKEEIEQLGIFESLSIEALGASEIQKLFHETKNKLSSTINFQNRVTLPDIDGVSEAYLGIIPFSEYLKLIQDENKTIHSIFDENVRDFQGENTVNKKIRKTLGRCCINAGR